MRQVMTTLSTALFLLYSQSSISGPNIENLGIYHDKKNHNMKSTIVAHNQKQYSSHSHKKYSAPYRLGLLGKNQKEQNSENSSNNRVDISVLAVNEGENDIKSSNRGGLNRRDRNI